MAVRTQIYQIQTQGPLASGSPHLTQNVGGSNEADTPARAEDHAFNIDCFAEVFRLGMVPTTGVQRTTCTKNPPIREGKLSVQLNTSRKHGSGEVEQHP